jgi:hypothetical protein
MDRVLISLLFFATSAMAKVRIGGGSIGAIDDVRVLWVAAMEGY